MAIAVPNSKRGLTVPAVTDAWILEVFGRDKRLMHNLFCNMGGRYSHLVDVWRRLDPDLDVFFDALKSVSANWYRTVYGFLVNRTIRAYMIYLRHPEWFYEPLIFASSFSFLRAHIHRTIKALNMNYLDEDHQIPYMTLNLKKKDLLYLDGVWCATLLPHAEKMMHRYPEPDEE